MYLDKELILDNLTPEDVTKVVVSLGSEEPRKGSHGELIFQSICHNVPNPQNSWKLYYYHDPSDNYKGKTFHCYSKCSESFSITELVIRAKRTQGVQLTWYKALYYIAQVTDKLIEKDLENNEVSELQNVVSSDRDWINRLKNAAKKKKSVPQLKALNEHILELFNYYPEMNPWLEEHCSSEALSAYEIGYYCVIESYLNDAISIPHRLWSNGDLIGVRFRHLNEYVIDNIGKYTPALIENKMLNHSLGNNLYGYHIVSKTIKKRRKMMVVEAEKSSVQCYSYFGDESFTVSACGSALTDTQIKIILMSGIEEFYYAPDRDYMDPQSFESLVWYKKQIKKLMRLIGKVTVYLIADTTGEVIIDEENGEKKLINSRLEYKDSPTDKGKDVLLELMKEKHEITIDEVMNVMNGEK